MGYQLPLPQLVSESRRISGYHPTACGFLLGGYLRVWYPGKAALGALPLLLAQLTLGRAKKNPQRMDGFEVLEVWWESVKKTLGCVFFWWGGVPQLHIITCQVPNHYINTYVTYKVHRQMLK